MQFTHSATFYTNQTTSSEFLHCLVKKHNQGLTGLHSFFRYIFSNQPVLDDIIVDDKCMKQSLVCREGAVNKIRYLAGCQTSPLSD